MSQRRGVRPPSFAHQPRVRNGEVDEVVVDGGVDAVVQAVAGVLVFLWLLAVGGAFVTSGWIHVLLLGAIFAVAATLFTPPRTV